MDSHVTTKNGDSGRTQALDGSVLSKDHIMIETVGTLDLLRTQTSLLRVSLQEQRKEQQEEIEFLLFLLHAYFIIGSAISDPGNAKRQWRQGEITRVHLEKLEKEQARLESSLHLPHSFIVCASNRLAAQADVTTAWARTFERRLVAYMRAEPLFDATILLPFVNRLSDYFFILARYLEEGRHCPVDYESFHAAL